MIRFLYWATTWITRRLIYAEIWLMFHGKTNKLLSHMINRFAKLNTELAHH